jgi:hypothetical protein
VALSTTGIILLSIFQKPSFVTIVLILDLTGRITLLAGCSWYPSDTNSARTTVDENIRKARRATYSLMGTGLHGEHGLDPETSISLLKTYILPILTYGLEIVIPKGKILDDIQKYYKKLLKQLLSLTINVADPAVYMISGLLTLEAEIHTKVFLPFCFR